MYKTTKNYKNTKKLLKLTLIKIKIKNWFKIFITINSNNRLLIYFLAAFYIFYYLISVYYIYYNICVYYDTIPDFFFFNLMSF